MDLHGNAALSWNGRRLLAERVVVEGWTLAAAAEAAGVSARCARKWVGWYRAGDRELRDRSSAPGRVWNRTDAGRVAVIMKLRRLRMTAAEIAETLAMPLSTVSGILTGSGLGRLGRIGLEAARRYERSRPGELVHVDVKKPGRIVGAGRRANRSRDAAMIDTDRLGAILDEYDSDPHTELLALIAAKARLRRGADPMEVLAVMEGIHDRGSEPRRPSQMAGLEARNVQRQGAWGRRRCDGGDARHNWWRKAHSLMRRIVDRESPRPGLSVPIACPMQASLLM